MKTLVSLLLYGVGSLVGCACVVVCLWGFVHYISGLLLPLSATIMASGQ